MQPLIGDLSAKSIAKRQPEKLAAMEAHFHTEKGAPLILGGIPDEETEEVHFAIKIPKALSILAFGDPNAEVKGLDAFPEDERPPVLVPHLSFQVMVGIGTLLMLLSIVWIVARVRKIDLYKNKLWLRICLLCTPLGFIALEAGWMVTEVGRQPWIIYKVMRTADAVTPVPGLEWSFAIILAVYTILGILSFSLLWRWFQIESERS